MTIERRREHLPLSSSCVPFYVNRRLRLLPGTGRLRPSRGSSHIYLWDGGLSRAEGWVSVASPLWEAEPIPS